MPEVNSDATVVQWLRSRRSIRRYEDRPVAQELLRQLLEAAIWAPSAHNRQPWRFAVLTGRDLIHDLASRMGERLRCDLLADGLPDEKINVDVYRSYLRLTGSPALIVVALSMADMDSYPDRRRQENEWLMAVQSTAMAGQNILLSAHALGLGACWMCAPLFCPEVVRDVLDLEPDWQPQGLISVGYPAESKSSSRLPLDEVVVFREPGSRL